MISEYLHWAHLLLLAAERVVPELQRWQEARVQHSAQVRAETGSEASVAATPRAKGASTSPTAATTPPPAAHCTAATINSATCAAAAATSQGCGAVIFQPRVAAPND